SPQVTKMISPKPRNQPRCKPASTCSAQNARTRAHRRTVGSRRKAHAYQTANGEKYCGIRCWGVRGSTRINPNANTYAPAAVSTALTPNQRSTTAIDAKLRAYVIMIQSWQATVSENQTRNSQYNGAVPITVSE